MSQLESGFAEAANEGLPLPGDSNSIQRRRLTFSSASDDTQFVWGTGDAGSDVDLSGYTYLNQGGDKTVTSLVYESDFDTDGNWTPCITYTTNTTVETCQEYQAQNVTLGLTNGLVDMLIAGLDNAQDYTFYVIDSGTDQDSVSQNSSTDFDASMTSNNCNIDWNGGDLTFSNTSGSSWSIDSMRIEVGSSVNVIEDTMTNAPHDVPNGADLVVSTIQITISS